MLLPDTPQAERLLEFRRQCETLTVAHAEALFEGNEGPKRLTEREGQVLELIAANRSGSEIQEILGISPQRVGQLKAQCKAKVTRVTGLMPNRDGELKELFAVLRRRLEKPLYQNDKMSAINELLEQVPSDQSAEEILKKFTSPEFQNALEAHKLLMDELNAGGLRALRARLGRWYPVLVTTAATVGIGLFAAILMLLFLGLNVALGGPS